MSFSQPYVVLASVENLTVKVMHAITSLLAALCVANLMDTVRKV